MEDNTESCSGDDIAAARILTIMHFDVDHASLNRDGSEMAQPNEGWTSDTQNAAFASSESGSEFNIFNAFLAHRDILLYLTTQHLEPRELFVLYRVSKAFHYIVNAHMTSYILSSARRWARLTAFRPSREPELASRAGGWLSSSASRRLMHACGTEPTQPGVYSRYDITTLLPFHNYLHLCSVDPTKRTVCSGSGAPTNSHSEQNSAALLTSDPTDAEASPPSEQTLRHVPTFRYLRFLLHRARTIQLIIHHLAEQGHHVPTTETPSVLAKLSLTLDIPTNARRFALFRSTRYWSNRDLYVANLLLVKIDMAFTDPVDGNGETMLRKLLLSQRNLDYLEGALGKTRCCSLLDTVRLLVRTWYRPAPQHRGYDILGVPASEVGRTGLEGWGRPATPDVAAPPDKGRSHSARAADAAQSASGEQTQADNSQPRQRCGPLMRPDELIIAEALRRELPLHLYYVDMMTYGYLDPVTLENLSDRRAAAAAAAATASNTGERGPSGASGSVSVTGTGADADGDGDGDGADAMDTSW